MTHGFSCGIVDELIAWYFETFDDRGPIRSNSLGSWSRLTSSASFLTRTVITIAWMFCCVAPDHVAVAGLSQS
jgi:hypothetical protein